jgi:hypothetical protein
VKCPLQKAVIFSAIEMPEFRITAVYQPRSAERSAPHMARMIFR